MNDNTTAREKLAEIFLTGYAHELRKDEDIDQLIFSEPDEAMRIALLEDAFALHGIPTLAGKENADEPMNGLAARQKACEAVAAMFDAREIGCCICFVGKSAHEAATEAHCQLKLVEERHGNVARTAWLSTLLRSNHVPHADPVTDFGKWSGEDVPVTLAKNAALRAQLEMLIEGNKIPALARWLARVPCSDEMREAMIIFVITLPIANMAMIELKLPKEFVATLATMGAGESN